MAKDISRQLEDLKNAVQALVAKEVAPVAVIAPVAPVAPILPIVQQNSGDHDLLTKLDTKVDQIQSDVTAMKAQNAQSPSRAEFSEALKVQTDHEARIRSAEKTITQVMSYGAVIIFLVGVVEYFITKIPR